MYFEQNKVKDLNIYFSDRENGYSQGPYSSLNIGLHVGDDSQAVLKNRAQLETIINSKLPDDSKIPEHSKWIFLNQTHEPNIYFYDQNKYDSTNPPIADACITTSKNVVLSIMTADCGPLIIAGNNIIGALHMSWKTARAGLIPKVVNAMKEISGNEDLYGFLGPCIYPRTYEFDPELLNQLAQELGDHVVSNTKNGKAAFDLPEAINESCLDSGVITDQVNINTYESDQHFSYRRDNITGRQVALAWLQ